MSNGFDLIVIGGGHAGCEAAHAAAQMGCRVALLTLNSKKIGWMSCNPAMGGIAKGQLIKEIDALGGIMAINTDKTAIQYRRLNASKGPAVRSSRAQCDKLLYASEMQKIITSQPNVTILSHEVIEILSDQKRVRGVTLKDGSKIYSKTIIVTSGTFLKAVMFTGSDQEDGGRIGDPSVLGLSQSLLNLGFRMHRLKTGTPPRLHKNSIHYYKMETQWGDTNPTPFSFYFKPSVFPVLPQIPCYITYTNPLTHKIIEENFCHSPLYNGVIHGTGPRYCPSIEDKVKRFHEKDRHQIFIEPEGHNTNEIYVNGISTSLPKRVQEQFVRSIVGLEDAEFLQYGYAVEYDAIDARQLKSTYESKDIAGLFFAGQINGTSGYEEAGAQGLLAGINAALSILDKAPYVVSREKGYMGVLTDDLILKGVDEPYRMFTSRAEYRLLLREDNADLRLTDDGRSLGLIQDWQYRLFEKRHLSIQKYQKNLSEFHFNPTEKINTELFKKGMPALKDRVSAADFLKRPEVNWEVLFELGFPKSTAEEIEKDILEQVEIQIKYNGYIRRDLDLLDGIRKSANFIIPLDLDFNQVPGLSNEVRHRLQITRPETLGHATRLVGMTPSAVAHLFIFLKTEHKTERNTSLLITS